MPHHLSASCVCEQCGGTFLAEPYRARSGAARFCSRRCSNIAKGARQRAVPVAVRFWALVAVADPDTCWLFLGFCDDKGYGSFRGAEGTALAHRTAWELTNGPIPEGLNVLHHCDNPPCCNPRHHFLGTLLDNNEDMYQKGRYAVGEALNRAGLTDADVLAIRRRYAAGGVYQRELAAEFGVSQSVISEIVRGVTWAHLPPFSSPLG